MRKLLNRFSMAELVIIALLAALGIALKSVIVPLVHIVTGPLYLPGGVVAGGLYMLFLVLATAITRKLGAATLTGFCQGIMVLVTGMGGSHGALSVVSYTLTGVAIDLLMLLIRHRGCCALCCFFGGMAANMAGTLIVNSAFFEMPLIPLVLSLAVGALSGGLGGLIANGLAVQIRKAGVIK